MNFVEGSSTGLRLAAYAAAAVACASPAMAQSFTPLWSFGAGTDGALPIGTLAGRPGRLFGATIGGGATDYGTVYTVDQNGREKILHSFTNGADGGIPGAGLIEVGGTLYGTNQIGGTTGNGVVFAIDAKTGAETTVYSFSGGADGGSPLAGVTYLDGYLYGTAFLGGASGSGSAFKIELATGAETTLHGFGGTGDGKYPESNLIAKGNELYGTASTGGAAGAGTIFRVNLKTGKAQTVYTFTGGNDGYEPLTALTLHDGTLYGTANFGGANNDGTLFSLSGPKDALTVLYTFTGAADGKYPQGALYYSRGAFYGTAGAGGISGYGTAFSLTIP